MKAQNLPENSPGICPQSARAVFRQINEAALEFES
jgi:hypothetical protein